jgi:hypothetical protein
MFKWLAFRILKGDIQKNMNDVALRSYHKGWSQGYRDGVSGCDAVSTMGVAFNDSHKEAARH